MMPFTSELLHLTARATQAAPSDVWRALPREDRIAGLTGALRSRNPSWLREYLAGALLKRLRGFRRSTIMQWAPEALAREAVKLDIVQPAIIRSALVALHFPGRAFLQAAWLDLLSIEHKDGRFDTDSVARPAASPEHLADAAERFLAMHESNERLIYLLAIALLEHDLWCGLAPWLEEFARTRLAASHALADELTSAPAATPVAAPNQESITTAGEADGSAEEDNPALAAGQVLAVAPPARRAPRHPIRLTGGVAPLSALDHHMIFAVVDAAAGVANHLPPEQVDQIINELVTLNGRRVQSYYHLGFRDVMFGRPPAATLPAENEDRTRWYYAGYIVGLERAHRTAEILALFDSVPAVQRLGDTGLGPSAEAGPHVFSALVQAGRYAEAAGFVSDRAVIVCDPFQARLLDAATTLLRAERSAEARPMLDTLWRALAERKANDQPVPPQLWSDVRRRRAHCLRQESNLQGAREMLAELVDDTAEADPEIRASALVDLGLIDAGFRRLADLVFPENQNDVADVRAALARGQSRFHQALAIAEVVPAHAHYVEGFRELLAGSATAAAGHLEKALVRFEARPLLYSGGMLLHKARLHLALAMCQSVEGITQMTRAAELIMSALRGGVWVPRYLVANTLEALALIDSGAARDAAEAILRSSTDDVLDDVARLAVARRSALIADALLRRARDESRAIDARVHDWHAVLPLLLEQGRSEDAAQALDALEGAASRGVEDERFLLLLGTPSGYSPAWDPEEALWATIQCLEARAEYEKAALLLEREFHRTLSGSAWDAAETAEAYLDHVAAYPPPASEAGSRMRPRLDALQQPTFPALDVGEEPIRVLFVGGDETQAQYDDAITRGFAESHPNVTVEFLHTGWTSNWSWQVEEFKRLACQADAIVFSRFMRTMFGRTVRSLCRVPWSGCGGKGRKTMELSILKAAQMARRHREQQRTALLPLRT